MPHPAADPSDTSGGHEPRDKPEAAVRDHLANERTLLAWQRTALGVIAIGFLINAGLGVYHAGAEWKWWPGPETCAGGFDLLWGEDGIVDTPVIRCDEAPWNFLGLSFAGWNAVVSAGLALIAAWGATRRA